MRRGKNTTKRIGPTNTFIPFRDEDVEQSVLVRFSQVVKRYPDRLAAEAGHHTLTYRELDDASDRIAQTILDKRGPGAEPVALLLDHDVAPIITILGILKTGKFYVALDPTNAHSRLRYILEDTQTGIIVTNRKHYSFATELSPNDCVVFDIDDLGSFNSKTELKTSITPDSLAAIYYTSGSTGQPKGVLNSHRNILHTVREKTNTCHMCRDDRVALLFSYSVSWSESVVFSALLNGGAVFPFDVKSDGLANVADWLLQEEITIFDTVSTVFRNFIKTLSGEEKFPKLRLISVGGETVHRRDVEFYRKHFPKDCLLRLALGMSEASSGVTCIFLDKTSEIKGDIMPVGYPVEGIQIMLLDNDDKDVGCEGVGEIAIKSRYLAPGYWRKPELTAQSFQTCPGEDNVRIYRTGDLGRLSSDGCLFHLGRKDFQVKVRGYRVETAEVERALLNTGTVSQAAVVARPDARSENRLVAYIVCNRTPQPTVTQLRGLLSETLPGYMLPSNFVFMGALPMTVSGKVDFKELPVPDVSRPELDSPFVGPRSTIEKRLADMWGEILDISTIGIHDDFFDLGGHSIHASILFALIEKNFGKKLPLSTLLSAPTIEELAAVLCEEDESGSWSCLVPIQRGGSKLPFFCVHNLTGDVVVYAELARSLGSDQPFYGLRAQGLDGKQKPYTEIEAMASHYIGEVRTVQPEGPYLLGGMCFGGVVAFEMAQQLQAQGSEVGLLVLFDTPCPPISLKQHLYFVIERYTWHLREDTLGIMGRTHHQSRISRQYGHFDRLRSLPNILKILRVDRANNRALRKYRPQCYTGRIVHFLARQPFVPRSPDMRKRWETYTAMGIEEHTIPGDHHTVLGEPHVQLLAKKLDEYLSGVSSQYVEGGKKSHR